MIEMATSVAPNFNPFGGAPGQAGVDASFVLISAFIVFTMQIGFALLESGMVSRRSQTNIMVKCVIDVLLGGLAYWFVGYGFSFGHNSTSSKWFSGDGYFLTDVNLTDKKEAHTYYHFVFQLAFATTATTIVSGAVAERMKLGVYMIFAIINTGLIYVFPCHWVWSEDGWLHNKAHDFAGSVVVHMSGGAASIAACLILKPRRGRFVQDEEYFAMANPTHVVLGTFFLWWGWIGFNCGSQLAISGENWPVVGRIVMVTMMGAMGGGTAAVLFNLILYTTRKNNHLLDIVQFTGAILAGLVSITAAANVIRPWEGLVVGFIGGGVCLAVIELLDVLKLDDPVGAIPVHFGGGLWAMIATGLFADVEDEDLSGMLHKGNGTLLGWNILAALTVTLWSAGCVAIVFLCLKYTIGIRLSEDAEMKGSDAVEHNIGKPYTAEDYYQTLRITAHEEEKFTVEKKIINANDEVDPLLSK